jgi:hypothetical protein
MGGHQSGLGVGPVAHHDTLKGGGRRGGRLRQTQIGPDLGLDKAPRDLKGFGAIGWGGHQGLHLARTGQGTYERPAPGAPALAAILGWGHPPSAEVARYTVDPTGHPCGLQFRYAKAAIHHHGFVGFGGELASGLGEDGLGYLRFGRGRAGGAYDLAHDRHRLGSHLADAGDWPKRDSRQGVARLGQEMLGGAVFEAGSKKSDGVDGHDPIAADVLGVPATFLSD